MHNAIRFTPGDSQERLMLAIEHLLPLTRPIRVNHRGCVGRTPNAVSVRRDSFGVVHLTCYRCGAYARVRTTPRGCSISPDVATVMPPEEGLVHRLSEWPMSARVWIGQARISQALCTLHGIAYSPRLDRVIVPITGGSIHRACNGQSPKYRKVGGGVFAAGSQDGSVVVVEDSLSAIRVHHATGTPSVALLTASLTAGSVQHLARYQSFVVWLDGDSAHVRLSQARCVQRLGQLGTAHGIHGHPEPKLLSDEEIVRALRGA